MADPACPVGMCSLQGTQAGFSRYRRSTRKEV